MTQARPVRASCGLLALVLLAMACGQEHARPMAPSFQIVVDSTLKPRKTTLPQYEDGAPRPVATLTDKSGRQADFVENELVVEAGDEELNAFLARWGGK